MHNEKILIMAETLRALLGRAGSITRDAATLIGEKWPLTHGWQTRAIGKRVNADDYHFCVNLSGMHKGERRSAKRGRDTLPLF